MYIPNLSEEKNRLQKIQDGMGCETLEEAAHFVLDNYQMFNSNKDLLLLAYCEAIIEDAKEDGDTKHI